MNYSKVDKWVVFVILIILFSVWSYYSIKIWPASEEIDRHALYTVAEIRTIYKPNKQEWTFVYIYSHGNSYYSGKGTIPLFNNEKYVIGSKMLIKYSGKNLRNSIPMYRFVSDSIKPPISGWKNPPQYVINN